ncbi:MAG TPA: hypothetical protein DCS07_04390 [Bdellovibrionales bacterium]|nr:MAG: hypothetical protein A2Z97_10380 [Bdellovibrionales bacterium GWB1_52_6]OFZ03352.1 MAG: hypothetical protein A2X97_05255 [Bdellovibrionales bacterium GWA1_52_35]HAR41858.1 hypothetical protein [Bdellovibrionales bacterium]HCM40935.1 hypothetical protein [Bdellovibrionales bacterium]
MSHRKHERFELIQRATWSYFAAGFGTQSGYISNISLSGCLLKTFEVIEHRRWVRIIIDHAHSNLAFTIVGLITRRENVIEVFGNYETTLYRYGIKFTRPEQLNYQDLDMILALSTKKAELLPWRSKVPQIACIPGSSA